LNPFAEPIIFFIICFRFFIRLHTISSRPNTLVWLCRLFESLVQLRAPEAFFHCLQLGLPPLKIALPWIMRAFSGCGNIPVDQVGLNA
jgi:hypothetical protein